MSGSHHNESHTSEKTTVAAWSLLASFLLAAAKFVAAFVSGSLGLLSEAFHSTMDFVATAVTFFAIRYAERPADEDHPFGHAKMESVAALIETAMLFGVTGWIVYEALIRLTKGGHEVEISWWIIAVVVGSIIIDFNRSRALQTTADKTQSDALAADALHFRADMWSSCAVLVGQVLDLPKQIVEGSHTARCFYLHFGCSIFSHQYQIIFGSSFVRIFAICSLYKTITSGCFHKFYMQVAANFTQLNFECIAGQKIVFKNYF